MSRKKWTKEEEEIIVKYYEYASPEELERLLPRFDIQQIRAKAARMGIKRKTREKPNGYKMTRWTKEETEKLIKIYSTSTNEELLKEFPRFTVKKINDKARRLGLKKDEKTRLKDEENRVAKIIGEQAWTEEEDQILIEHYPYMGIIGTKRLLPHRSRKAIESRIYKLGIKKEVDVAWERKSIDVNKNNVFSISVVYERIDR